MSGTPGPIANMDPTANGSTKVPFYQAGSTAADAAFGSLKQRGKSPANTFHPQITFTFPNTVPKVPTTTSSKTFRGLSLRTKAANQPNWVEGDLEFRGRSRTNTSDVGLSWDDTDLNRQPWVRFITTENTGGQSYAGVYNQKWYTLTANWERIGNEVSVHWEINFWAVNESMHKYIGAVRFADLGLPWEEAQVSIEGPSLNNQPLHTFTWYNV
jgi:hypothetical protein